MRFPEDAVRNPSRRCIRSQTEALHQRIQGGCNQCTFDPRTGISSTLFRTPNALLHFAFQTTGLGQHSVGTRVNNVSAARLDRPLTADTPLFLASNIPCTIQFPPRLTSHRQSGRSATPTEAIFSQPNTVTYRAHLTLSSPRNCIYGCQFNSLNDRSSRILRGGIFGGTLKKFKD